MSYEISYMISWILSQIFLHHSNDSPETPDDKNLCQNWSLHGLCLKQDWKSRNPPPSQSWAEKPRQENDGNFFYKLGNIQRRKV